MSVIVCQRAGAVFPKRSERSAPVFTPPQTHPLSSYPPNLRSSMNNQATAEASGEAECPILRFFASRPFTNNFRLSVLSKSIMSDNQWLFGDLIFGCLLFPYLVRLIILLFVLIAIDDECSFSFVCCHFFPLSVLSSCFLVSFVCVAI